MKTILLLTLLTICRAMVATGQDKFYAFVECGAGTVLNEPAGIIKANGGYQFKTDHMNFFTELHATYFTNNRGQISLLGGFTAFTEHLVLYGGGSTVQYIYMGKYQPEVGTKLSPSVSARYFFQVKDFLFGTKDILDGDMSVGVFHTYKTWTIGISVGSKIL